MQSKPDIRIFAASVTDAPAIARLLGKQASQTNAAVVATGTDKVVPHTADIELLLRRERSGVLLAQVDGTIVGLIGYAVDGTIVRLFSLSAPAQSPRSIANGEVAQLLIAAAEEAARALGLSLVATHAVRPGFDFDAFVAAGYVVDFEEPEAAGGGVITVADLVKLL